MNKDLILESLVSDIKLELEALERIARDAHMSATHGELQAEGKYDTQAIEAGYLAGAQAKRAAELRSDLLKVETLNFVKSREVIVGSLILLDDGKRYFISPATGGGEIDIDGNILKIISNSSPLGRELLGLQVGDVAEFKTPAGVREVIIKDLF